MNLTAESGELTLTSPFAVYALGAVTTVFTPSFLLSALPRRGFVVVSPLGCGKAVAFLSVFSESRLLTVLSRFLYGNQRSLSGSFLSVVFTQLLARGGKIFPPSPRHQSSSPPNSHLCEFVLQRCPLPMRRGDAPQGQCRLREGGEEPLF